VNATIAGPQQQEQVVAKAQPQLSSKKRKKPDNTDESKDNCTDESQRNIWDGLCSAFTSDTFTAARGKPPPPTVKPLKDVKPGEIIPKSMLLDEENPIDGEPSIWINDPVDDPELLRKRDGNIRGMETMSNRQKPRPSA
jgi:hypothetical protein